MTRALLVRSGAWSAVVVAAVLTVAAWLWWSRATAFSLTRDAERNILLVTIDTLRGDALGSYGGRAATPNLDALAARGARFTFAHSHAVLTLPSHASILTGRYPYEHGIRDNAGFRVRDGRDVAGDPAQVTGFATGAFVSAFPLDQRYGLQAGFDEYDDRISEVGKTTEVAVPERRADVTVTAALDWIGRQSGKWFGWVHVFDPHAPYAAPDDWRARYPSDAYAGEVAWTDFALGPLLSLLEQQTRPTVVIVTADHGESLGEHGEMTHGVFAYEATLARAAHRRRGRAGRHAAPRHSHRHAGTPRRSAADDPRRRRRVEPRPALPGASLVGCHHAGRRRATGRCTSSR